MAELDDSWPLQSHFFWPQISEPLRVFWRLAVVRGTKEADTIPLIMQACLKLGSLTRPCGLGGRNIQKVTVVFGGQHAN